MGKEINVEEKKLSNKSDDSFLPSAWEQRFEDEINQLFDDAIDRLPRFVDKYFRSFRRVMKRNISLRNTVGDLAIGLRNLASGVSEAVGGPEFETSTYTEDEIAEAFEREVLSPQELENLLGRLFDSFEEDLWSRFEENLEQSAHVSFRERLQEMIDAEIAHDPKLAQAVRSGIHIGIPMTLGYFLFNRSKESPLSAKDITSIGTQDMSVLQRMLHLVRGKYEEKSDDGFVQDIASNALGITGALLGSLVVGGLFEYTFNSMRDLKGSYIRQINTARYVLLYGTNPSNPSGRGILHIVRAIERKFDELPGFAAEAFNLWLESGIDTPSEEQLKALDQLTYFPSDEREVTLEEALEISLDATIERTDDGDLNVTVVDPALSKK